MERISTRAEVDLDAIRHNYHVIKSFVEPAEVSIVVKGNAYGHGSAAVVRTLLDEGCSRFWVAHLDEGLELRQHGLWNCDIHVLGGLTTDQLGVALEAGLIPFISDVPRLRAYDSLAADQDKTGRFHLKVDTGMGRLGILPDNVGDFCEALRGLRAIHLEGVGSHVAMATIFHPLNELQYRRFLEATEIVQSHIPDRKIIRHLASSAVTVRYPEMHLDMVRPGSLVYGLSHIVEHPLDLKPALSLKTVVVQVKEVPAGWNMGYGDNPTQAPRRLALLPMGQVDGMTPTHGREKNAEVLIRGSRCPIVSIAADQMIADVTALDCVEVMDEAVVIGRQGCEEIGARELGWQARSSYGEILMKMSHRVPRLYYSDGDLVETKSLLTLKERK